MKCSVVIKHTVADGKNIDISKSCTVIFDLKSGPELRLKSKAGKISSAKRMSFKFSRNNYIVYLSCECVLCLTFNRYH